MIILLNIFLIVSINNEEKRLIGNVLDNLHYYASVADGNNYFNLFDEDAIFLVQMQLKDGTKRNLKIML